MATFGQGINPALGRIDYSGYQQGAMAGAQGIGQGIAALGQAAGQAINQYYRKQEEKQIMGVATESVASAIKSNPALGQQFGIRDPNDIKAINVGIKAMGGGDAMKGAQITLQMLNQLRSEDKMNSEVQGLMNGSVSPNQAAPEAVKQFLSMQAAQANIGKTLAETAALGAPKADGKAVDPRSFRSTDEQGRPIEVTIDVLTGKEIARGPLQSQAPQVGTIPEGQILKQRPDGGWTFEKIENAPKDVQAVVAKERMGNLIGGMADSYIKLDKLGGIVNPDKSVFNNVAARVTASDIGQLVSESAGSEAQTLRQRINAARPLMISAMLQSTGMSARALDSNRELQIYLEAMSDPKRDIVSNLAALYAFDKFFGSGTALDPIFKENPKLAERITGEATQMLKANPIDPNLTPQSISKPEGIPQAEWDFMSPEDRALFR